MNEETLFSLIPLSIAVPLCCQALLSQNGLLLFIGLLYGVPGILGLIDDAFLESRLLIRLLRIEPEQTLKEGES